MECVVIKVSGMPSSTMCCLSQVTSNTAAQQDYVKGFELRGVNLVRCDLVRVLRFGMLHFFLSYTGRKTEKQCVIEFVIVVFYSLFWCVCLAEFQIGLNFLP